MMNLTRRDALALGAGTLAAVALGPRLAFAATEETMAAIKAFTGGANVVEDNVVTLEMPEIAENGNTVPLSVSVNSPMTADSYCKRVIILAEKNPRPGVCTFNFTPKSGVAEASTRMRLAKTQDVVAIAEMSDGTFHMTKAQVKVTIGGCGG